METDKIKLNCLLQDIQSKYEKIRNSQLNIIKDMETLDDTLTRLEDEKELAIQAEKQKLIDQQEDKKRLKTAITRIAISALITLVIIAGFNWIMYKSLTIWPYQIITLLLVNATAQMVPYFYFKKPKTKVEDNRTVETIQKEYDEKLKERLSKSSEFVKNRKLEAIIDKVRQIIKQELVYIEQNGQKQPQTSKINTSDIYSNIQLDSSFIDNTPDEKSKILDTELNKYLRTKVSEGYLSKLSPEELLSFTNEELVNMLSSQIPIEERSEKLGHIIHALLGIASATQGYSVIWYEETDEKFIDNPEIVFDDTGRLSELKTHSETDYAKLFTVVYDAFINKVIKVTEINKPKTKKRIKK